jgi:hypothetical protein
MMARAQAGEDPIEQEADNTAPAASDASIPRDAAANHQHSTAAPTGAPIAAKAMDLPPALTEKARAIAVAIEKASTVRALDQIQLAQRATLDSIALANPAAHEWLMQKSRDRVAALGGA